ncbi:hypothetical protein [Pseudomonas plecoglossicida]|uniref:hypothetical protein n=1 Tax=Pseudomonas plecoglossicida TaxID=70775 RepID=UPI00051D3145|nr:hypothetical protein [Pseudomonas plecoglossicida]KGK23875.1 hypothetical protein GT93_03120 [Pseudomonas plecoglossicida]
MSYWNDLLPRHEALKNMTAGQLKATEQATESCVSVLAHGISGIGHLLACTASNGETGLSSAAVTDIGWLLESLGSLVGNLSDTGAAATYHLSEVKPGA